HEQPWVQAELARAQATLTGRGRAFIRPSGTEPVIRVTVEADDAALVDDIVGRLAEAVARAG
ncbi:MAG: phosphoglucosamine mutase, partial [Lysobacteraceae bacterium]